MDGYEQQYANQPYEDNSNLSTQDDEYAGQIREQRVTTLLTEIDPEKALETIEYRLRGYVYNKLDGQWVKKNNIKSAPEQLIEKVVPLVSSILNLNTTFSNLQVTDVNRIMSELVDTILSDLTVNGKKYGIHSNFIEKERIALIIFNPVYLTLRRCINGMEAKRFFGSLRMSETIQPQRRGILGNIFNPIQR